MAEQTGIRVGYETVRQVLKRGEIVLSRPQHTISSPEPEYKLKKTIEETRDGLREGDAFSYADEFDQLVAHAPSHVEPQGIADRDPNSSPAR